MTKANELSETKQAILATLYLCGVRSITITSDGMILWHSFEVSSKDICSGFIPNTYKNFCFSELKVYSEKTPEYFKLENLIKEYCPNYLQVLQCKP